jgi:hypothetical protein
LQVGIENTTAFSERLKSIDAARLDLILQRFGVAAPDTRMRLIEETSRPEVAASASRI